MRNLSHTYNTPDGPLTVLNNLSFDIPAGGYASLMGPSGSGKSTLLSILGGLEAPQNGAVDIAGHDLLNLRKNNLAAYRLSVVGFVFQHFGLLDALTATENVELACTLARVPRKQRHQRARDLLNAVGLSSRSEHRPLHLSGGERQRVAIARALANNPLLLLADEPTGNLDDDNAKIVIELLESISADRHTTLVIVTHNPLLAKRAPISISMKDGSVAVSNP